MDKEAQSKSILNMLSRNLNPMEMIRYHGFEEYKEVYDAITQVDSKLRAKVFRRRS
jgi:hypothetical protein